MIIGAVVSGLGSALYPYASTVAIFLFIRLFHGFSTGFKPTATSAYVADIVSSKRRGEALGILSMFGTIGTAAGPALGSQIYLMTNIDTLFYVSSGFAVASVLILAGMKETLQPRKPFTFSMLKINRSDIYEPKVMEPSVIMLLTTLTFGTVVTLSPDFSEYLGIMNKGLFFTFFSLASLGVRIIGGKLSDKFGRLVVLKFSTFILAASIVIIGFSTSVWQFFLGAALFGIGYGLNSPTLFAWTIDLSPDQSRGRGISTVFIFLEVGIGTGSLISGTLYQGDDQRFPYIFAASALFPLIAFLRIIGKKK
jgi:MFS family permease